MRGYDCQTALNKIFGDQEKLIIKIERSKMIKGLAFHLRFLHLNLCINDFAYPITTIKA